MDFTESKFVKDVIRAYLTDYKSKDNGMYELNSDKCDKMNDIIAYCKALETEYNCKIIRCMLEPKHEHGYVQVMFSGELVFGEKAESLKAFIETLKLCDGVNITTNPVGEEMFQITFFVENLWMPKRQ